MAGLEEYQRKRNFTRTPEPGGAPAGQEGHRFVVQKHAARRLHFDLRLELEGALKSWAVPKGPSSDPAERRLAVHVEDHPLDYAGFEGIIPEGEYGAGAVQLWDRGNWEPVGDAHAGYRKGHLRFRLHGHRLHGEWTLARMRGREDSADNWLLIKHDDRFANQPLPLDQDSIESGRSLDQIAAGIPTPPAAETRLPATLKPQLATLVERVPDDERWLHEIKFDGYRTLCRVRRGHARLFSRNGKDWTDRFRPVARAVEGLALRDGWIDGEIAVLQPDGSTSFQRLQEALSTDRQQDLVYFVFDLPFLDGEDLRPLPLTTRKAMLLDLLESGDVEPSPIRFSDHITGNGPVFHTEACKRQLEGIVSKRADSPYQSVRSRDWLKVKCLQRQEFVVVGYTDPGGSRKGFGALLLGVHENGGLVYTGRVGTGFDQQALERVHRRLQPLEQSFPPVEPEPAGAKGVHWVRPELVGEVAFAGWTRDGRLRHPSWQGVREDKPAEEVTRELPQPITGPAASPPGVAGPIAGLRLSHPDKVLYPAQGMTKRQLAEYYAAVADRMLPYLRDRPLTLLRCPDGRHGECFYQKHHTGRLPSAIRQVALAEKGQQVHYMAVDTAEGIVALVQLGVLEIHVWGSRCDRLEQPDLMVFDLDPEAGLPWQQVTDAAWLLRDRLATAGLRSFLKTTGGKGLHIVVPLARRHDWATVKEFSRAVARSLVGDAPSRFTASPSKRARSGRIFVDYLRNGRGATAIAPFSTRAREGAPVAVPISWEELTPELRGNSFDTASVVARLQTGADPWHDYFRVRQSITRRAAESFGFDLPAPPRSV